MRIMLLLDRYLPVVGGAERQAAALAAELRQSGVTVQVLTRRLEAALPAREVLDGVPVRRLAPVGLSKAANALMVGRVLAYLLAHAAEADLWQVYGVGPVGLAALIAGRLTGKPVLLRPAATGNLTRVDHEGLTPTRYSRLLRRYLFPPALWNAWLRQAAGVIAISPAIAAEAAALLPPDKIHLIPNGVDVQRLQPASAAQRRAARQTLGLPPAGPLLLFTGRLVRGKRVDVLLEALPHLLPQYPALHLVLAGSGAHQPDDVEAALRAQVAALGLQAQVTFAGLVTRIDLYLQAADAFVFPTEKEGMPNVVLEAMAAGLPIVASRASGVVEVVDDTTAWLPPVGDVAAWVAALHALLAQPDQAAARAAAARHRAVTRFSLAAMAERYQALYRQLRPG
ncbi:MAG: glycosyltransferase family 4 protein [Anaerolineae bacterium]|nr:glycosyltransferase family 4 protein [Anaerolineae bacterium]